MCHFLCFQSIWQFPLLDTQKFYSSTFHCEWSGGVTFSVFPIYLAVSLVIKILDTQKFYSSTFHCEWSARGGVTFSVFPIYLAVSLDIKHLDTQKF